MSTIDETGLEDLDRASQSSRASQSHDTDYPDDSGRPDHAPQSDRPGRPPDEVGGILGSSYRALTIGIVTLVLLVAFEAMAVTTAMPVAVRELHGLPYYAWGFSGFMTATMFATVVAGQVCDRMGPVLPFLAGVGLFAAGLVVAGSAPAIGPFIGGRVIQGLGGGAIIVTLYVIAGQAYPAALRPRLFTAFSSAWVVPSIVGPLAAGVVTERASWRLVFLGLVPLVIAPLVLMLPRLRRLPRAEEPPAPRRGRKRLALAAALGIGLVQYAGQELSLRSLAPLAVGLVLLMPSLPRLLPRGALRFRRGLPSVVGLRGVVAGTFFGANSFLPLMLVQHRHLSASEAGLALTVGALGWTTGSWWQGRPATRTPRHRLIQVGTTFVAIGIVLVLIAAQPAVPVWISAVGTVIAGLGMGLTTASLSVLLLDLSPREEQGANSAAGQMSDSLGQVTFIGMGGVIFAAMGQTGAATTTFSLIFTVMIGLGLAGVALAHRVRVVAT